MRHVLVSGAAGFLGRHLVRSLLADGHEVTGVDSFVTSDPTDLNALRSEPSFHFEQLDITQPEFRRFVRGRSFDALYNLACPTGVPNLGPLGLLMLQTSYEGSMAMLESARACRAPVLLASTAEVYGNPEVVPQSELYTGNVDTLGPRCGYEEGKRVAESLFGLFAKHYGVQTKIVRIFNTYGQGMSLEDTRVVPAFIKAALTGSPLMVHGNGLQTRCLTHVTDMTAGIRAAMSVARPGYAYNLGSTRPVTVLELARSVIRLAGSASTIALLERPSHDHDNRLPDTTRSATELGWLPSVELEEGLAQTIQDFRARLHIQLASVQQQTRSTCPAGLHATAGSSMLGDSSVARSNGAFTLGDDC